MYKEEYLKNPTPLLATKIANCLNWSDGYKDTQVSHEMLEYYNLGMKGGIPAAIYRLEWMYRNGKLGVEKNLEKAKKIKKRLIYDELNLPPDIEQYEAFFASTELDDPHSIKPTSTYYIQPKDLKEKIITI